MERVSSSAVASTLAYCAQLAGVLCAVSRQAQPTRSPRLRRRGPLAAFVGRSTHLAAVRNCGHSCRSCFCLVVSPRAARGDADEPKSAARPSARRRESPVCASAPNAPCPARPPKMLAQLPPSCTAHPREIRTRWGAITSSQPLSPTKEPSEQRRGARTACVEDPPQLQVDRVRLNSSQSLPHRRQDETTSEKNIACGSVRALDEARATDKSLRSQVRSIERGHGTGKVCGHP